MMILALFLWIRRKRSSQSFFPGKIQDNSAEIPLAKLCYTSLNFSRNQEDLLYSNIRPARPPQGQAGSGGRGESGGSTELKCQL
ncbi:uncharacterized protein ACO6RY_20076 [Pungitius sinensis]